MASCSHSTISNYHLYSGAGNRFILSEASCPDHQTLLTLCNKHQVDGLLLVLPSSIADARFIIFNNDGSRASMCGNGLRCVIAHVASALEKEEVSIETDSGVYQGVFCSWDCVIVNMTLPHWNFHTHRLSHALPGLPQDVFSIDTGVPHLVVFVSDLSITPVDFWGRFLRYHKDFSPQGTNVNFAKILNSNELQIRTYERGLERESAACGTGATAVALVSANYYSWQDTKITIRTWNNILLGISLIGDQVFLEGPVNKEGEVKSTPSLKILN
ncbi:bifunctional diaminopimelate epimerase/glutamate racemase [Chlamydia vaughanii]|uniref:bifunctional diaminopimelate epimerase/glutamate racemase n=1 Tax=Chlamydia vaughanii TaxID=3112552 RepID=UPI0032B12258